MVPNSNELKRYDFKEALELVRKTYPYMAPRMYVAYGNGFIFNLISLLDEEDERSIANFCIVNPKNGKVSSCYSSAVMFKDPKFRELWKDSIRLKKSIEHSDMHGSYLAHYGIKGQSWGVRNGPPYPLNQKTHDRVLRKHALQQKSKDTTVKGMHIFKNAYNAMEAASPLGAEEKAAKIKRVNQANEELSRKNISDISDHRVFSDSNPPKIIRGRHSIDDDAARVNPKFKFDEDEEANDSPTGNNCGLCAFTYDLRRRGYDVTAKCSVDGIQPRRLAQDIYQNPEVDFASCDSWDDFFESMPEIYSNGSRGMLSLYPKGDRDSGHAVNFEIQSGKLIVIDPQSNDRDIAWSLENIHDFDPAYIEVIRTDNLKVNLNQIHKVCNEYKDGWEKTADQYNSDWREKGRGQDISLDEMLELLDLFGIDH